MAPFSYEDIFLTHGIEYLLVIDFLLIFILFWKALTTPIENLKNFPRRPSRRKRRVTE
jgi:hypothetical protein